MMTKEKILLIAGCSNAAGHEIDGQQDSVYNRKNCFGARLADKMGYAPVNIALGGQSNPSIMRSVLTWLDQVYNPETQDLIVLVAWTESSRMDIPSRSQIDYKQGNLYADWFSIASKMFRQINAGMTSEHFDDVVMLERYQEFQAHNLTYLEIISAHCVLLLQYFLKLHRIRYVMCNTMKMFDPSAYLSSYLPLIDLDNYMEPFEPEKSFFWYYRDQGYQNPKARYWHHDEIPHELYAQKLYDFIN